MGIRIGIDASRNRSGGAKAHIIGILNEFDFLVNEIEEIHIWSYKKLLDSIADRPWLIKHTASEIEKPLAFQLYWQFFILPKVAKHFKIDVMLNTDAGSICRFKPSITMSRDMLSYEKGEIDRYGVGFSRLRLIVLRYVQNYSLKNSEGVIFLTEYASKIIQKYSGPIINFRIIPHGISNAFRIKTNMGDWDYSGDRIIKCVYVSNVDLYKHQWNIVKAISNLRLKGYKLTIDFIGGGIGEAQKRFARVVEKYDKNRIFVTQHEFLPHSVIAEKLKEFDVFIFASSCENMPNTLVEGMASGLPIISSNRGPMPEVLKDGGLYFDPENCQTIEIALEKILLNKSVRVHLSKQARMLSDNYSWKRCSNETFRYLIETYNLTKD